MDKESARNSGDQFQIRSNKNQRDFNKLVALYTVVEYRRNGSYDVPMPVLNDLPGLVRNLFPEYSSEARLYLAQKAPSPNKTKIH